jgi:antitoxin component of RelBE/YafQ-DinJ toxin-antitoxin module
METRIQFRISEETKRLAQQTAERRGVTLSDACRRHAEELAEEQRKVEDHEDWLREQVNEAFARLDNGTANFTSNDEAKQIMEDRKAAIRKKHSQVSL